MASTESELRAFLESRSEAIRTKSIDRLMSFYSPEIVYFDIVPPLQYVGSRALRSRFLEWFDAYEGSIRQEIHDVTVSAGADVAATSMLIRSGGGLKTGHEVDLWVRATSCCRYADGRWSITHEHISVPVDLRSGRAILDLAPQPAGQPHPT